MHALIVRWNKPGWRHLRGSGPVPKRQSWRNCRHCLCRAVNWDCRLSLSGGPEPSFHPPHPHPLEFARGEASGLPASLSTLGIPGQGGVGIWGMFPTFFINQRSQGGVCSRAGACRAGACQSGTRTKFSILGGPKDDIRD